MSTTSNEDSGLRPAGSEQAAADGSEIADRKARHLEICVEKDRYSVETGDTGFAGVRFLHRSLPEIDSGAVDTRTSFLDHTIALPILVSCMTGGSANGNLVNRRLAEAAQLSGIPVGTGSIRILFRDPSYFEQFHMKALAPDVPVIANLSAVQLRELDRARIVEMLKRLEVQALAVHLNVGQELFQPNGDRDFRGLKEAIPRFCEQSPVPVIVKETGFGIRPSEVDFLLSAGVAYVDLAGAGGTNWVRVESYRVSPEESKAAREFDEWGIPTAMLLCALHEQAMNRRRDREGTIIASGGLRSGLDLAKSLALGATLGGFALPFARAVHEGGADGVLEAIRSIERGLRTAMTLTGSRDLSELRSQRLLLEPRLAGAASALLAADADQEVQPDG